MRSLHFASPFHNPVGYHHRSISIKELTCPNRTNLASLTMPPALWHTLRSFRRSSSSRRTLQQKSYIKFHAWQSIFLGIAWFAISVIAIIPILGWLIFLLGSIALFIAWIIALLKALKGERYKLPFIGNLAEKQAGA